MNDEKEIWKLVTGRAEGYPYEVSNFGRVRRSGSSLSSNTYVGRVLKPNSDRNGYVGVSLYKNGIKKTFLIHSLVADAFLDPPPGKIGKGSDHYQIDHDDNDKTNNHISNLEWVTKSENNERRDKDGLSGRVSLGENHGRAKLTERDVRRIRRKYATGRYTQAELADAFRVSESNIWSIVKHKTWKHI